MSKSPATRIGVGLAVLVVVLSSPCAAPRSDSPAANPSAHAQIERIVAAIVAADGGSEEAIPAMADELQRLVDGDRVSLLQQLVLYLANSPRNEQAMSGALLIEFYKFSDEEKIAALVPYLETRDDSLRHTIYEVLSTVDRPAGGEPDFGPYESVLRRGAPPPAGLIRYLYSVSPIDALAATARAYADEAIAAEAVLRAQQLEGLRSDVNGARELTEALSRDEAWPVRLYAAYMIRWYPELRIPAVVDRLGNDPHALVRDAITW